MATETLPIPEHHLAEFCAILRTGLKEHPNVTSECREGLDKWLTSMDAHVSENQPFFEGEESDG